MLTVGLLLVYLKYAQVLCVEYSVGGGGDGWVTEKHSPFNGSQIFTARLERRREVERRSTEGATSAPPR